MLEGFWLSPLHSAFIMIVTRLSSIISVWSISISPPVFWKLVVFQVIDVEWGLLPVSPLCLVKSGDISAFSMHVFPVHVRLSWFGRLDPGDWWPFAWGEGDLSVNVLGSTWGQYWSVSVPVGHCLLWLRLWLGGWGLSLLGRCRFSWSGGFCRSGFGRGFFSASG